MSTMVGTKCVRLVFQLFCGQTLIENEEAFVKMLRVVRHADHDTAIWR